MTYLLPGQYRIALPPGIRLVTSNGRENWRMQAGVIRHIRETARRNALGQGIPGQHHVHVRGVYYYPDNRWRDPGNLSLSVKAMIDGGLVDTGIIPDDNDRYLADDGISRGYPNIAGGQLILVVQGSSGYKFQDRL